MAANNQLDLVAETFQRMRRLSPNPPRIHRRRVPTMRGGNNLNAVNDVVVPGFSRQSRESQAQDRRDQVRKDMGSADPAKAIELLKREWEAIKASQDNQRAQGTKTSIPTGPDGRKIQRRLSVPSLGAALRKEIRAQGWEHDLAHGWVIGHWAELVGDTIAKHAVPDRIEEQILHVRCDDSNWATNLRYAQRTILQKIAAEVGPNIVAELKILGPKQHRNYEGRMWVKPQGSQDTYG